MEGIDEVVILDKRSVHILDITISRLLIITSFMSWSLAASRGNGILMWLMNIGPEPMPSSELLEDMNVENKNLPLYDTGKDKNSLVQVRKIIYALFASIYLWRLIILSSDHLTDSSIYLILNINSSAVKVNPSY